jgi:leucyl aminopeptidase
MTAHHDICDKEQVTSRFSKGTSLMADSIKISVQPLATKLAPTTVIFVAESLDVPAAIPGLKDAAKVIKRHAAIEEFKGKSQTVMVITAAPELSVDRLIVIGMGKPADLKDLEPKATDFVTLGGVAAGRLKGGSASIIAGKGATAFTPDEAADLALGMRMRHYSFDKYRTKKKPEDEKKPLSIALLTTDAAAVRKSMKIRDSIAEGINIARDLVNEPPNILNPVAFAKQASQLASLGVKITVLDEKVMTKLGMRALLAVGQGSRNESKVVIMEWNGAKSAKTQPVAFVGKGVTFDTGGISIKPAGGMEDMKGDMAGAACVTGLIHALAGRKAKVNAIGVIGLVENMPDGNAQRPGDIVTSMSGQTIEIINTDAEGRLVLADILWHTQATFKPQFMINLATLTGAILVALGQDHAGLFSNNDALAKQLASVGKKTGERVWRMPLDPAYDKIIDSKFADVKNSGGRYAGSITAAQFLKRFVNDCPWAHLDIAGTGMSSSQTEINKSWGSGWGVRLLNQLVADHYEDK